jgi:Fe-Mn family superoxide dismutase
VFNNAAQIWNHNFFWNTLKINNGEKPSRRFMKMIEADFGTFEDFQAKFKSESLSRFGSGWVWFVQK